MSDVKVILDVEIGHGICPEDETEETCKLNKVSEAIQQELLKARINSLLDLEQWIKLHDLGQEMILDGIEHMVKSNLQVPDQPRINHDDRIADLQAKLKGDE